MRYSFKSNWISYKRIKGTDEYLMKNHLWDEEYEVSAGCIEFINQLDGKTDPMKILMSDGMTRREANSLLSQLKDKGVIRSSKKIPYGLSMRSLVLVNESYKYKEISTVLLFLLLLSFFPAMYEFFYYIRILTRYMDFLDGGIWQVWLGIGFGILVGSIFHELFHAISCVAFSPTGEKSVFEFGLSFNGLPGAYTLMDTSHMSKTGCIVTYLAGIITNFIIAAICIYLATVFNGFVTLFFYMGISNIELGLVNCLFIESLDGRHAIDEIIGNYCDYKSVGSKKHKRTRETLSVDEKLALCTDMIFLATKIIYPAIVIFNITIFLGW